MPAWQTPTVHATGDIFAVNDNNILANNETFLYQAPYASYYNNAVCSVANPPTCPCASSPFQDK